MSVRRLNHAVLYVRDARIAAAFYREALDFEVVAEVGDGAGVFLKAAGTDNHHDLGLFSLGPSAPGPQAGRVGLYHLAWQVADVHDLVETRARLLRMGAFVGESDHGVSTSVYGRDPDGNEFEVMWEVPRADWGADAQDGAVRPLDLDAVVARYG